MSGYTKSLEFTIKNNNFVGIFERVKNKDLGKEEKGLWIWLGDKETFPYIPCCAM